MVVIKVQRLLLKKKHNCSWIYYYSSLTTITAYYHPLTTITISSVPFSRSVMSDSWRPHGLQHARPPCPSPTPGACSNSCPSSQWCYPTISSSGPPSPAAFNLSRSFSPSLYIFIYTEETPTCDSEDTNGFLRNHISILKDFLNLVTSCCFFFVRWPDILSRWRDYLVRYSWTPSLGGK